MNYGRVLLASCAVAALAACAPGGGSSDAAATASPVRLAAQQAAAPSAPLATQAPASPPAAPTASPMPVATATPGVSPSALPSASAPPSIMRNASDPPQILSYSIDATTVHPGDTVSGIVLTTSNVASVEASVADFVIPLSKTGVGRFELSYVVPNIPRPFRGTYALKIIAHNALGATTSQSTSLTIK